MKYRTEYDPKVIGKNLKRLRLANKLSVKEVQKYLRLGSPQAYYKYENGSGYPPSDNLLALMELYNADLHDIIDDPAILQENDTQKVKSQDIPEMTVFCDGKVILITKIILIIEEHRVRQAKHLMKYSILWQECCKIT